MSSLNSCTLYFGEKWLSPQTPEEKLPFSSNDDAETLIHKRVAITRALAIATFAVIAATCAPTLGLYIAGTCNILFSQFFSKTDDLIIKAKIIAVVAMAFFCPIPSLLIGGAYYSGRIIYSNFLCKDPLIEAFHKICGGKENFNNLPTLTLNKEERTCEALEKLSWDNLEHSISKATTADGRTIVIVKSLNEGLMKYDPVKKQELEEKVKVHQKHIYTFIERVGPPDFPKPESRIEEFISFIFMMPYFGPPGNGPSVLHNSWKECSTDDCEDKKTEESGVTSNEIQKKSFIHEGIFVKLYLPVHMANDLMHPVNSGIISQTILKP